MSKQAELADGTILEFPDDTPDDVIDRTVKAHLGKASPPAMAAPPPVRSDRELFAFDSPYAKETGVNGLQMLTGAFKEMFGNQQAAADYLAKAGGGSVTIDPVTRQPVLVSPKGQRYFLNDPGFGKSDVGNIIGNVGAYLPAAKAVQGVAGLGNRMAVGAAASGATDTALQLGTTGEVDPARALASTAFGGAGELVAPMLGAIYRSAATGSMSRQELVKRGREQIQRMRVSGEVDDMTAMQLGRELDQIQAGGDPNALISEAEFGFRYTQGQKTGDHRQLTREEMLRNSPNQRASMILTNNDRFNYDTAIAQVDNLQKQLTGNPGRVNITEAVDRAGQIVRSEEGKLKSAIGDAYEAAGKVDARIGQGPQADLQKRIPRAIADLDLDASTPAALRSIELIRKHMDTRALGRGDGGPLSRSLHDFDQTRKLLRSNLDKAANPTDKRAVTLILREYDNWLDDTVTAGLVKGDPKAVELLKNARKLRSEYGRRFEDTGEFATRFDTVVRAMVKDGADPEQLATTIYGASQVSQTWANRAFIRIDMALGNNPQAKKDLRAAVLTRLVQGKTGETVGLQQLQTNLKTLLNERPTLARNVLGQEGTEKVRRLVVAIEPLLKTVDKRSSGTAERMWRYVTSAANAIPVLGPMVTAIKGAGEPAAAVRALEPLRMPRPNIVPAVGASLGQEVDY